MYETADDLRTLAEKVMLEKSDVRYLQELNCQIAYLWSDKEKKSKSKLVYADTEKVSEKVKSLMPYDFIITFYKPNCEKLRPEKLEILMYHELLHVGFDDEGKTWIVSHDLEDFEIIVKEYGYDWIL